ncbi:uncharacterized protein [Diabrotica undecimpunctata]|uniref:uncharacterized protein n=1 Tax=Diabrotica undecimpunctata TaxID=50387 RepID=UPI003B635ADE
MTASVCSRSQLKDIKMTKYCCKVCNVSFSLKKNLSRHFKNKHAKNEVKYDCEICEYSASRPDTLLRHKSYNHRPNFDKVNSSTIIACAMCDHTSSTKNLMLKHYKLKHDITLAEKESFTFASEDKFFEWKLSVENSDKNNFVLNRGKTSAADGKSKSTFYCFRDGYFKSRGSNVRQEKMLGSNKINGHCPAKMEVITLPTGEIKVEFFKTHVGHQNEVERMRLSKKEKDEVAKYIASKIPFDNILDNLKASLSNDEVQRRDLIKLKDMHNIARDYNLKVEEVSQSNDSTSVHSWVVEMQKFGKIVIFYKPQGSMSPEFPQLKDDDFVLVIMNDTQREMLKRFGEKCVSIDSTHGLNSYGLELTTLFALDDVNQGFPCTFMFSNRTDGEILQVMLQNVRDSLGGKIKTNIFMSDVAEDFFNAWQVVMEPPNLHLFCSWHVDEAWRKNLCKIKGNKENQAEVYKMLRTLMVERDNIAFEQMFKEVVESLKSDPDTTEFGEYFCKEYQRTVSYWAYCYRPHGCLNTSIHLERMHIIIKHIYLKGNKHKRVDVAIQSLMRFLRDKLTYNHTGKLTSKISAIKNRHQNSLQLDVNDVTISDDWNLWKVFSKDKREIYEVTKIHNTCTCDLKCDECKICIHDYICTCTDSLIKFNMCKHIHLIKKVANEEIFHQIYEKEENDEFIHEEPVECVSQNIILSDLQNKEIIPVIDLKGKKELIMNQFLGVLHEANSEDDLELINKMISQTQSTMRARNSLQYNSIFLTDTSEEPPIKRIKQEGV